MGNVPKTIENMRKCICKRCPSYTFACKIKSMPANVMDLIKGIDKTDHHEGLYCAYEKSRCIDEEKGCICGKCVLTTEYGLDKKYYCTVTDGK